MMAADPKIQQARAEKQAKLQQDITLLLQNLAS